MLLDIFPKQSILLHKQPAKNGYLSDVSKKRKLWFLNLASRCLMHVLPSFGTGHLKVGGLPTQRIVC